MWEAGLREWSREMRRHDFSLLKMMEKAVGGCIRVPTSSLKVRGFHTPVVKASNEPKRFWCRSHDDCTFLLKPSKLTTARTGIDLESRTEPLSVSLFTSAIYGMLSSVRPFTRAGILACRSAARPMACKCFILCRKLF